MVIVSTGVDAQPYTPVKLPSSKEAHIKTMMVGLKVANATLSSPCADPILPLVATLAVFKATLDSQSIPLKGKEQIT